MDMGRITDTVIGGIEAGEAIGTVMVTAADMVAGTVMVTVAGMVADMVAGTGGTKNDNKQLRSGGLKGRPCLPQAPDFRQLPGVADFSVSGIM